MKKFARHLTLAAVIMCGAATAIAQGQIDYESRHEIGIAYGFGCNSSILNSLDDATTITATGGSVSFDNSKHFGTLSGEYFCRLRPAVAFGAVLAYANQKKDALILGEKEGECKMHYITIMPALKLDWMRRDNYGLYSKLALGVTVRDEKQTLNGTDYNDTGAFFNWQASLIGAEAGGRHIRAFAELGFGEQGIFLAGVRCKF